jgi:REP element-mobilizing transposase RayT
MARPIRIEYEGAVYHVTLRGNHRCDIFQSDGDRDHFLNTLAESLHRFDVCLYLFCLMTNHVHLVLATPRGNLSRFMHRLQTAYTVYFNRRNRQSGHLMQGRFGASLVDEDEYILRLSRYVHLNPVFTKAQRSRPLGERIKFLRAYPWSSYRSYIGRSKPLDYVDYSPVLYMISPVKSRQPATYRRFVEAGIDDIDAAFVETKERSRLCIGSDACHERIEAMYQERVKGYGRAEDISFRRQGRTLPVEQVLDCVCQVLGVSRTVLATRQRDSMVRPVAAKTLCDHSGLTQRQVAEVLNLTSGGAVSKQLEKLSKTLEKDKSVKKILAELERLMGSHC